MVMILRRLLLALLLAMVPMELRVPQGSPKDSANYLATISPTPGLLLVRFSLTRSPSQLGGCGDLVHPLGHVHEVLEGLRSSMVILKLGRNVSMYSLVAAPQIDLQC
jgi:hypothetical protein